MSKVSEEIASKNAEKCHCRQPHCRFMLPLRGPHKYPHKSCITRKQNHLATFLFAKLNAKIKVSPFLWLIEVVAMVNSS